MATRECQCFKRWGAQSPKCQGTFEIPGKGGTYLYCPPCRPLAKKIRDTTWIGANHRKPKVHKLNKKGLCTACEIRPIRKGNATLCTLCYQQDVEVYSPDQRRYVSRAEQKFLTQRTNDLMFEVLRYAPLRHVSCDQYSQEEMKAMLDSPAPLPVEPTSVLQVSESEELTEFEIEGL